MLRKHNDLLSDRIGNVNITQHLIDLIPAARPFKSAPYRIGPKTGEIEQLEIYEQLKAGAIEHYVP